MTLCDPWQLGDDAEVDLFDRILDNEHHVYILVQLQTCVLYIFDHANDTYEILYLLIV